MAPALGSAAPKLGAGFVCLDAGPLIDFNDAKRLDLLEAWFAPIAYTPEAVVTLELAKRPKQNNPTTSAPWLHWVKPHPNDAQLVAELLRRFGKGPPENQGEAEVVAACKRYGWTAVLDDEQGRRAADDEGVPHVYVATLLAVAAAHGKLTPTAAWKVHAKMQQRGRFSPLKPDAPYKAVFVDFVDKLRTLHRLRDKPEWPLLLAEGALDDLLLDLVSDFNRTP